MKEYTTLVVALILSYLVMNGQSRYEKEMQSALDSLNSSEELQDFKKVVNKFEQISRVEKDKWLPHYYVGYVYTVMTYFDKDTESRDLALDKAQEYVEKARRLKPKNEEISILQAYIYQSRFFISPMTRLTTFVKSSKAIAKVVELYPDNPRANLLQGIQFFHKPSFLGGGSNKAKPFFKKAEKLFTNDESKNLFYPNWGRETNKYYSDKCK